ncbi:MAG: tetratricopeptide repeat protein [Thermoanaerobaculia bacterium]|nr:tetratricopeptide repeat protein [Thermoanaerobaculia bacterium]
MALFGRPAPPVSRLEELKRVLIKDPTSRQFLALADEYRKAGKLREAMETLERGLTIHATYVAAHVALGRVNMDLGRPDHALENFLNALKYDRENLVALRMAGDIYLQKGEKVEAIKKLKVFRALSPGDKEVNQIVQALDVELAAARKAAGLPDIPRTTASYLSPAARREAMASGLKPTVAPPPPSAVPPPFAPRLPSGVTPSVTSSQPFFSAGIVSGVSPAAIPSPSGPPAGAVLPAGGISYSGFQGPPPAVPPAAVPPPFPAVPPVPSVPAARVPFPVQPAPSAHPQTAWTPENITSAPAVRPQPYSPPPPVIPPRPPSPGVSAPPAPLPVPPPARPDVLEMTFDSERRTPLIVPKPKPTPPPEPPPAVPAASGFLSPLVEAWVPPASPIFPQPFTAPPPPVPRPPVPPVQLPVSEEPARVPQTAGGQPPLGLTPPAPVIVEHRPPADEGKTTILPIVPLGEPEPVPSPAETVAISSLFQEAPAPKESAFPPVLPAQPSAALPATPPRARPSPGQELVEIFESVPVEPEEPRRQDLEALPESLPPVVERSGGFEETPFGLAAAEGAPTTGAPSPDAEGVPQLDVFGETAPAGAEAPLAVSETLAELYRAQGYVDEARATYEALARVEPERAEELTEKAAHVEAPEALAPQGEPGAPLQIPFEEVPVGEAPAPAPPRPGAASRLFEWAENLAFRSRGPRPEFDLGLVLDHLTRAGSNVSAAFLTTTDGLPLASAGEIEGPETESFIGDLTSFWKSAESRSAELETGGPQSLFLEGSKGLGVVAQAGLGQLLLIMARPEALRGQLRFEARRAASVIERGLS